MGRLRQLLIPHKTSSKQGQPDYSSDMRAIEQWAMNVGGIIEIVAGSNVTIDNGFGPVVTVNASGGGGGYASLTGPGETMSPGALTQAGGFTVNESAAFTGTPEILLSSANNIIDITSGERLEMGGGSAGAAFAGNTASIVAGTNISLQAGDNIAGHSPAIDLITVDAPANLPTPPPSGTTFALIATGHIYVTVSGGAWTLLI